MSIVYIVDDDQAVQDSIALLLRSADIASETFSSAQEFLLQCHNLPRGCILLDIRMPGMSGLEMQQELNRKGFRMPIVFLTGHGDVPMAVQALKAGASDFLQKPFKDQQLLDCLNNVLEADQALHNENHQAETILKRHDSLTEREREVMSLITDGKSNKVIAYDLGISQRTVEIHRANVFHKMEVRNLAELMRALQRIGYFEQRA